MLVRIAADDPALVACVLPQNRGKGAAILHGLRLARTQGYTHALTVDADGQHSVAHIGTLIAESLAHPDCMILGQPLFDSSAPQIRVFGHRLANFCTGLLTPRGAIADSLFGFRIYPIGPLLEAFAATTRMRRFDFDSEAVIRLHWQGVRPINVSTPVRYFRSDEGGISFSMPCVTILLLTAMYCRLAAALLARSLVRRSGAWRQHADVGLTVQYQSVEIIAPLIENRLCQKYSPASSSSQKAHQFGDLARRAGALHRHQPGDLLGTEHPIRHGGGDDARCHGIDGDASAGEFQCQCSGGTMQTLWHLAYAGGLAPDCRQSPRPRKC